jgi:hypothetical protein
MRAEKLEGRRVALRAVLQESVRAIRCAAANDRKGCLSVPGLLSLPRGLTYKSDANEERTAQRKTSDLPAMRFPVR